MPRAASSPSPPQRRPVSRRRYAVRRLAAVATVGLLVFGAVKGVGALTGGGEAAGEEPAATSVASTMTAPGAAANSTSPAAQPVSVSAATQPSTTAAPTTTAPNTEPVETGPPSADNPAEVLIVGDSDAGTFAPYLEVLLDETGIVESELDYVVSSGLARPDFYDWPANLRQRLATSDPDIVIVTFGGNDAQLLSEPCPNGAGTCEVSSVVGQASAANADEWTAEYVRRVQEVMDIMTEDPERRVIWVGIPNASDPEFTALLEVQDGAVREALEGYDQAVFVDTWDRFDGRNGGIAELVVDPRDGKAKRVRSEADGFHLNEDGAEILAIDIFAEIETILEEWGAEI